MLIIGREDACDSMLLFSKMIYGGPIFLYTKKKKLYTNCYFLYHNYTRIILSIIMIFINANFSYNISVKVHSIYRIHVPSYNENQSTESTDRN